MTEYIYCAELDVDTPHGQRTCIGELSPYRSALEALSGAVDAIGRQPAAFRTDRKFFPWSSPCNCNSHLPVCSFTLHRYDQDAGTDVSWQIHGDIKPGLPDAA